MESLVRGSWLGFEGSEEGELVVRDSVSSRRLRAVRASPSAKAQR